MNNPKPALGNVNRWKAGIPNDKKRRRLNAKSAAEMIGLMVGGKPTMHELVEASGLCIHTVRAYVKAMHLVRACHISGWAVDKRGAYMTPKWSLGSLPDAERPMPLEHAERMRAQRKAAKARATGIIVPAAAFIARRARL